MERWLNACEIRVHGPRALEFLQGYLTCDVSRLEQAANVPMALCNLQGRTVVSGWVARADATPDSDAFLIVHASLAERTITMLAPYARFARCTLEATGTPAMQPSPDGPVGTQWVWQPGTTGPDGEANAQSADAAIERSLIEQRFAWLSEPVSEKFLPQMLALEQAGAVDFDKGCYLGQEIVARAQHRGAVKRHLQAFTWRESAPAPGTPDPSTPGSVVIATAPDPDGSEGIGLLVA